MNSKIRRSLAVAILTALTLIPFTSSGSAHANGLMPGPYSSYSLVNR